MMVDQQMAKILQVKILLRQQQDKWAAKEKAKAKAKAINGTTNASKMSWK